MGGFARRAAAGLVSVGLLLSACGKSATAHQAASTNLPQPTVPPTAPTTTTPANPYAIPATIDAAYVDRVLKALDHVDGDATRLIVGHRQLVPDAARRLSAIYGADEFTAQTNIWLDMLDKGLADAQANPGDVRTTVNRVLTARSNCVFVHVLRDFSKVAKNGPTASSDYLVLSPLDRKRDPNAFNPTPWVISREGYNSNESEPTNPCNT